MSTSPQSESERAARLDLSRWRKVPLACAALGSAGAVTAALLAPGQFAHSWLLAFMFFLSLALGSMFLVMIHHLFDAGWSVPIRRFGEHISCLTFPYLLVLFLPIAFFAPSLYPLLQTQATGSDTPLKVLFGRTGFYIAAALCFTVWGLISNRLRVWSRKQDETGSVECTRKMRFYSVVGMPLFAVTISLAAMLWLKSLAGHWFSTIYGIWYFAGSVWTTLALIYLIALLLRQTGHLRGVLFEGHFYFIGSLLLAFTIFYAYVSFSQYFIIWNANIPEEVSWYVAREKGAWWWVGLTIIFGHFLFPFLALLRIDWKLKTKIIVPLCAWALLMHFVDLQFQIMPKLHPNGPAMISLLVDLACMACVGGILTVGFLRAFSSSPFYPQRDPRMAEALDVHSPSTTHIAVAPERAK